MDRRKKNLEHVLDKGECAFFNDMPMMIVTSSPISDDKRVDNESPVTFRQHSKCEDNPTWSDLLGEFQSASGSDFRKCKKKQNSISFDEHSTTERDLTSSSYEPIAEHKMKILVTPSKKIKVLSSSARKISLRQPTPKKMSSYSKAQQQFQKKIEEDCHDDTSDESMETIRTRLKSTENITAEDIERYERTLRRLITQNKMEASSKNNLIEGSDLMHFVESQIGQCDLSPRTVKMLVKHNQNQEKKLISLAVTKKKSATEIKKKINQQLIETKQQIKNREQLELKLVKAAHLRREATANSTLFNQAHTAHHRRVVAETQQKEHISQLERKIKSEKNKSGTQINKIVQDVWKTFLQEQYNELRKDVREQQSRKVAILKESQGELERLKTNYEEKLKELKDMAKAKAAEAGMEKKEISRDIERIQRNMQQQFRLEFQTLLRNIETKEDHKRFAREENASRVREQLKKADYVFDM